MEETPQRVLVVIPHPSDAEFWCAGSIARWIGDGATVRYVVCTDGSKGTTNPEVDAAQPSGHPGNWNRAEAARVLGVQEGSVPGPCRWRPGGHRRFPPRAGSVRFARCGPKW